jgi:hypothetical protein
MPRSTFRASLLLAAALLGALAFPSASGAAAPARGWGVTMPGVPWDTSGLASLSQALGRSPNVVMWYDAWSNGTPFPAAAATTVAGTGATVEVTWEPWDPAGGVQQPAYADARIAAGSFDAYLRAYAQSVRSYGKPVVLRLGHEMNGNWYPWSIGVNGNTAADYVAAFRHVHDVFAAQGATNVTWAWVPNVPYTGSADLPSAYPGDAYVDQVGLDGYNWGTTQSWGSTWQIFGEIFGAGVGQLQAITSRPIWLGEVASTEVGGNKAAWITDMFATLAAHPEVAGFTWFDFDKETDWRIDSSATSLQAFRNGLVAAGA